MRLLFILLFTFHYVLHVLARCPDHSFIGCMLRLKAQRVPIEKNIMSLVFGIGTEARLLHTCKVYSSTNPCFQDKIKECGDEKQKRILNEVSKTIMYLCSPFSLQRQRLVIEHQKCISAVLSLPASTGCSLEDDAYGRQVLGCKKECASRGSDFICMMRTWISEQNTCTFKDIDQKCGPKASALFQEFQTTVFEPTYPVVCSFGNETIAAPETSKVPQLKTKRIKTYRKPTQKSKTEIQEYPLVLTSPSTLSTADNIYIGPPEPVQNNVYMRPQRPNLTANVTNNIVSLYPSQEEVQEKANIWKKGGYGQKVQYNKEHWKQKTTSGDFVFTTQHPLFTTTELGATPRRHKVIDILKSLIPPNLPSQLTALLENSYDKETFAETHSYNTPSIEIATETLPAQTTQGTQTMHELFQTNFGISLPAVFRPEPVTTVPQTSVIPPNPIQITFRPTITNPTTSQPVQSAVHYQIASQPVSPKWKPWYLSGA